MTELTPEEYRATIQRTLRGERLKEIVDRWFQGAPVDLLAAELAVSRDALWEVLEPAITARTLQANGEPVRSMPPVVKPSALAERPRPTRALRRSAPATAPAGVHCAGQSCVFGCSSVCGRTINSTNGTPRV